MTAVAKSRKETRKRPAPQTETEESTIPFRFVADPPPLMIPDARPELETVEPSAVPPLPPPAARQPEDRGLECRECGCRDLRVVYTRPMSNRKILRCRECRHCGRRISTTESERLTGG
jgi:hypothetical protein